MGEATEQSKVRQGLEPGPHLKEQDSRMKVANRLSIIALNCCFHEPKLFGKLTGDHRFPMCGDAYQSWDTSVCNPFVVIQSKCCPKIPPEAL